MILTRRRFLQTAAVNAGTCTVLPLLAPRLALSATANPQGDTLICIFLRGGADALNVIVPFGDGHYYDSRPTLAIPTPDQPQGALALDSYFGLHPSLAPLLSIFDAGRLAMIQATGSPADTRSHFTAQDYMERGYLAQGQVMTGWLARHLALVNGTDSAFRAVGATGVVQTSLRGPIPATALEEFEAFDLQVPDAEAEAVTTALAQLYGGGDFLALQGQQTLAAVEQLELADPAQYSPNGVEYPNSELGNALLRVGQLLKAETLGVEAVCIDTGGWDTHDNQTPTLEGLLADLATSLAAFEADMGPRMDGITVVTQSEFGRRVAQNASGGTDHGHGGFMCIMGGGVNGGVYADWPGLGPNQLYDGRDLQVTLDWRTVLGEMLDRRLGNNALDEVFPEFSMPAYGGIFKGNR
ncbi:MAG: DUF1501 domain-containing protein [Candidatus Competibacterales bacterium]